MRTLVTTLVIVVAAVAAGHRPNAQEVAANEGESKMVLGNFSVSLAVKDLAASRAFYEKLGFERVHGEPAQNWVILQNGTTTIGLFQGMFPKNILTFNPGWNHAMETLEDFTDVRAIQARLEAAGVEIQTRADPASTGPASFVIIDPDGNPILVDQHVPAPGAAPSDGG